MYALAAPSCPDDATEAAIEAAKGGERITAKKAKEIIKQFVPPEENEENDAEEDEPEAEPFSSDPANPEFNLAVALNELEEKVLGFLEGWPDTLLEDAANYLNFLARKVKHG